MKLETTRFGAIDVDSDLIITFTQPIIGFPEHRRFIIIPAAEGSGVKWLQSVESGDLAFLAMDPRAVMPDYRVDLGASELAELAVESSDALDIYTLVVVPQDRSLVRTNLKAPILVNPRQKLAKQTILERSDYPVQYLLARGQQDPDRKQEAVHARSDS
jgi:flagellar assembly factor FliW